MPKREPNLDFVKLAERLRQHAEGTEIDKARPGPRAGGGWRERTGAAKRVTTVSWGRTVARNKLTPTLCDLFQRT
jgi:hypothetical protein